MRRVFRTVLLLWSALLAVAITSTTAAKYAPNHFLGKCLDKEWVAEVEKNLSISSTERDAIGRLKHPHLHAAAKKRRYTINDPRINGVPMSSLYNKNCTNQTFTLWGLDATLDQTDGAVLDPGTVDGSLIVEYKGWASYQLNMMVFVILANETLGYDVSIFNAADSQLMGERMSPMGAGLCTPVHVNVEEWGRRFTEFSNTIYKSGAHMYGGRSGLYTTTKFVKEGASAPQPYNADFWRDYATDENLIKALDVDLILNNTKYFPPKEGILCQNETMGCFNQCSKTYACTAREDAGAGNCLGIALMYPTDDSGMTEAVFANNHIPSYHCFLGGAGTEEYALEMEANGVPVVFYHYEPDLFHIRNAGKFERVFLPRTRPDVVQLNTATFGENGYGGNTTNPVWVDFPVSGLSKYGSLLLQDHSAIAALLSRFSLGDLDIQIMLGTYAKLIDSPSDAMEPDDLLFSSACQWLRENYQTWQSWLGRMPVCSVLNHVDFSYAHCDDGQPREVVFSWTNPDPEDPTKSFVCDGAYTLQPPMKTSRSCEWLRNNYLSWISWAFRRPPCDQTFYAFNVSECDSTSKRTATFYWLLPDENDPSISIECIAGAALPDPVEIDCEYTPMSNPLYNVVAVIAWVMIAVLSAMIFFVVKYRNEAIVKRSQFEFLIVMIVGGIMMCFAATLYGGRPSKYLCSARPIITSLAFTLVFGSLLVKSMRVYRVFMTGAMKRVVLSTSRMFKILGMFVAVDVVILMAWLIFDFPAPQKKAVAMGELNGGTVYNEVCLSSSFIFTALLIFWKAIVLLVGLYLSFLIRNVSTDFQESVWIFASSVVVLFGSVVILPMAYLVDLPAIVFFAFLGFMLLGCTAMVMAMMLVPKVLRLHEHGNDTTTIETHSGESVSENTKRGHKTSALRNPLKATTQVTPIQEFKPSKKSNKSTRSEKSKRKKDKSNGPGTVDGESSSSSDSS